MVYNTSFIGLSCIILGCERRFPILSISLSLILNGLENSRTLIIIKCSLHNICMFYSVVRKFHRSKYAPLHHTTKYPAHVHRKGEGESREGEKQTSWKKHFAQETATPNEPASSI